MADFEQAPDLTRASSQAEAQARQRAPQEAGENAPEAFLHAAAYTAVQAPISGVASVFDQAFHTHVDKMLQFLDKPQPAPFWSTNGIARTLGTAVGMAPWMYGISKGVGWAAQKLLAAESLGLASRSALFEVGRPAVPQEASAIAQAFDRTDPRYMKSLISTRLPESHAGSFWEGYNADELQQTLRNADWQPYNPVDAEGKALIKPPAVGFSAKIAGGRLGMIPISEAPADAQFYLIDPKGSLNGGEGNWSLATSGVEEPRTTHATLILGPEENAAAGEQPRLTLWTVHPGEPVAPSTVTNAHLGLDLSHLPESGVSRRLPIERDAAQRLGFGMAKIESSDNVQQWMKRNPS